MNHCPNCKIALKPGQMFCHQCGAKMASVDALSEEKAPASSAASFPDALPGDDDFYQKGVSLLTGSGGERDLGRAVAAFLNAVEEGNPQAMYSVAMMYLRGLGVEQKRERAIEYMERAAAKNLSMAIDALALMKNNQSCDDFPLLATVKAAPAAVDEDVSSTGDKEDAALPKGKASDIRQAEQPVKNKIWMSRKFVLILLVCLVFILAVTAFFLFRNKDGSKQPDGGEVPAYSRKEQAASAASPNLSKDEQTGMEDNTGPVNDKVGVVRAGVLSVNNDDPNAISLQLDGKNIYSNTMAYSLDIEKIFYFDKKEVALVGVGSGGTACPMTYVFISLFHNGQVVVSDEFGTCSDIPEISQKDDEIVITMPEKSGRKIVYVYQGETVREVSALPLPDASAKEVPTEQPSMKDKENVSAQQQSKVKDKKRMPVQQKGRKVTPKPKDTAGGAQAPHNENKKERMFEKIFKSFPKGEQKEDDSWRN